MGRKIAKRQKAPRQHVSIALPVQQQSLQPPPVQSSTYPASYDRYHPYPPPYSSVMQQEAFRGSLPQATYSFNPPMTPMPVAAIYNPPTASFHQISRPSLPHPLLYHGGSMVHHGSHPIAHHQSVINVAPPFTQAPPPGHYYSYAIEPQTQGFVGQPGFNPPNQQYPCRCCQQLPYPQESVNASHSTGHISSRRLSSASGSSYGAGSQRVHNSRDFLYSSPSDMGSANLCYDSRYDAAAFDSMVAGAPSLPVHADWISQAVLPTSSVDGHKSINGVENIYHSTERQELQNVAEPSGTATLIPSRASNCVRGQQLAPKTHQVRASKHSAAPVITRSRGGRSKIAIAPQPREERTQAPRLLCHLCDKVPDGFGGQPELDRHIATQHNSTKKWLCIDPISLALNGVRSKCHNCHHEKLYPREDNAASHLRRMHFNMREPGVGNQHRGGTSGGKEPSLKHLKEMGCLKAVSVDDPLQGWLHAVPPTRKRKRTQCSSHGDSRPVQHLENVKSGSASPDDGLIFDPYDVDTNAPQSSYSDASGSYVAPEELSYNNYDVNMQQVYEYRHESEYVPRSSLGHRAIPSSGPRGSATFVSPNDMPQQFFDPNFNSTLPNQVFEFEGMDYEWPDPDFSGMLDSTTAVY